LQGNDTVFNASLLGSKLLSYCYRYTKDEGLKDVARGSVVACCNGQAVDGSWVYGMLPVQGWIDSFHTGYNLDGLIAYQENTGDMAFAENIERGFDFYIKNFFNEDGSPKYYHNQQYPIDIHCPGQLFVTLHRLGKFDEYRELAAKVLEWTVRNMQDRRGYFYYQLKKGISSKISYMRWSNAFMFNALSYYILSEWKIKE
jgi:rhamnogalacturonyl hydrolase YesR